MKVFKKEYKKLSFQILSVLFGSFVWTVGINGIIVHKGFLAGGVSGISLIIFYLFHFPPLWLLVFLFNIPIFILGWKYISKKFFFLSLLGYISFSFFLMITSSFNIEIHDKMIAAILSGILGGIGSGIVFRSGASLGGTDIVAMIFNKKFSLRVGTTTFVINALILGLGLLFFNIERVLFTMVFMFTSATLTDKIISGFNQRKAVFIISDKSDEISKMILKDMNRGVTFIEGKGGYTGEEKKIIFTATTLIELSRLKERVLSIDPAAFIIINDSMAIIGKGFPLTLMEQTAQMK
ncbi:MAG: YitT family protein [Deltaproteobacteria bacterium]|nr:YitT family protein [Deltaproteobacteria bacterium]